MTRISLFAPLLILILAFASHAADDAAKTPPTNAPVVLLKLDDLMHPKDLKVPVSPGWKRVTDFLAAENVKANYGIICESLEGDCDAYIAWIKERHASGMIEFWNHGYLSKFPNPNPAQKLGEYLGRSSEEQAASLKISQELAKEKLGFDLRAFGPHATPSDDNLFPALRTRPEIVLVWFYGPSKAMTTDKVVLQRRAELELPIFKPNPGNLRDNWAKYQKLDYLALQGHPNSWDDQGFENFKTIVKFLREQGCRFVTASEYLAARPTPKPAPEK